MMSTIESPVLELEKPLAQNAWSSFPSEKPKAGSRDQIRIEANSEIEGHFRVRFHSSERAYFNLLVLNGVGQIMMQKEKKAKAGHNLVSLDLTDLAPGKYKIRLLSQDCIQAASVLVS